MIINSHCELCQSMKEYALCSYCSPLEVTSAWWLSRWLNPHAPSPCKDHVHFMSIFGPMPVDQTRTDGTASLHGALEVPAWTFRPSPDWRPRPCREAWRWTLADLGKMVISWASNTGGWLYWLQPATQWCLLVYKPYKYRSGQMK